MLIKNVPSLSLLNELTTFLTQKFGPVSESRYIDNPEIFSLEDIDAKFHEQDCILVKFEDIIHAILSKKKLPCESFYGRK